MPHDKIDLEAFRSLQKEYQDTRRDLTTARQELAAAKRRARKLEELGRRANEDWNARLEEALARAAPGDILSDQHQPDPGREPSLSETGLREELRRMLHGYGSGDVLWALCWTLRGLVKKNFGEALVIRTFLATRPTQGEKTDEQEPLQS